MSRITSAKSARVYIAESQRSSQANIALAVLASLIVIFSEIPLFIAVIFIVLLISICRKHTLLIPPMKGELYVDSSGHIQYQGESVTIRKVIFTLDEWCVWFWFQDGRRVLLWRDSLDEGAYRHLLVVLKKEH
ncbi:protein YgfX [Vibrio sinaloensis]|uniref:protein YgfX n=1 Tax=Photobacterium sp. (strain ATCC 43367) TaxID=379097 RepID=UPI003B00A334